MRRAYDVKLDDKQLACGRVKGLLCDFTSLNITNRVGRHHIICLAYAILKNITAKIIRR